MQTYLLKHWKLEHKFDAIKYRSDVYKGLEDT